MLSVTEARKSFLEIIKEIDRTYGRYILTKNGKPIAALISFAELEGWLETLEISGDREWVKALEEAEITVAKFNQHMEVEKKANNLIHTLIDNKNCELNFHSQN